MNDHVHLFISTHPNVNLIKIINIIKGSSSFLLRSKFPELKKLTVYGHRLIFANPLDMWVKKI